MAKIKIKMEKLSKIYNKSKPNEKVVLKNIDLQINDGELVGIIGKSGAGKSTLLNIMACIERFTYGSYKLMGTEIGGRNEHDLCRIRNERIGLVMQDFALVEELTSIENVMIPLDFSKSGDSGSEKQALKALEDVGCYIYQGYLYSPAIPLSRFRELGEQALRDKENTVSGAEGENYGDI